MKDSLQFYIQCSYTGDENLITTQLKLISSCHQICNSTDLNVVQDICLNSVELLYFKNLHLPFGWDPYHHL